MALSPLSIKEEDDETKRTSRMLWRRAANALLKYKDSARNVKRKKNGNSTPFSHVQKDAILPFEIIVEILSRLPPKSLLRFQHVCKKWQSLFPSRYFMIKYSDHYANDRYLYNVTLPRGSGSNSQHKDSEHEKIILAYGCDGLLLLTYKNKNKYCLWNPTTRLVLELPDSPHRGNIYGCILTYVPETENYRVVCIYKDAKSGGEGCQVLTPGQSEAWRSLTFPEISCPVDGIGKRKRVSIVVAAGAVHCIRVVKVGCDIYQELVSLDTATECFTVTSLPKGMVKDWRTVWALDWNGKLAFTEKDEENYLHVLVLEDYKKNKWGEKVKITGLELMKKNNVGHQGDLISPLFVKNNDLWMWWEGKKVIIFSIETSQITNIRKINADVIPQSFCVYKPSMITFEGMKPDTELERLRTF